MVKILCLINKILIAWLANNHGVQNITFLFNN